MQPKERLEADSGLARVSVFGLFGLFGLGLGDVGVLKSDFLQGFDVKFLAEFSRPCRKCSCEGLGTSNCLTLTLEFLASYLFACVAQSQAISFELSTTQTAA